MVHCGDVAQLLEVLDQRYPGMGRPRERDDHSQVLAAVSG
jgi:hypothetical protein